MVKFNIIALFAIFFMFCVIEITGYWTVEMGKKKFDKFVSCYKQMYMFNIIIQKLDANSNVTSARDKDSDFTSAYVTKKVFDEILNKLYENCTQNIGAEAQEDINKNYYDSNLTENFIKSFSNYFIVPSNIESIMLNLQKKFSKINNDTTNQQTQSNIYEDKEENKFGRFFHQICSYLKKVLSNIFSYREDDEDDNDQKTLSKIKNDTTYSPLKDFIMNYSSTDSSEFYESVFGFCQNSEISFRLLFEE